MWQVCILLLCVYLSFPTPIFAHIRGKPIMKINGQSTNIYPAQIGTSTVFDVPADADIAPQSYIKNEKLDFFIDSTNLPVPQDVIQRTNITWDFGDGTKKERGKGLLKTSHSYTRIGTHILQVTADYTSAGYTDLGEQPVQTTILNVLPNRKYQLPTGNILINGKNTSTKKTIDIDLNTNIMIEVVSTTQQPVFYQWDLGDGVTSNNTKILHRYQLPQYYVTPIVRVKDQNGFFTDTFVSLRNSGKNDPNNPAFEEFLWNSGKVVVLICILLATFLIVFWQRRTKMK